MAEELLKMPGTSFNLANKNMGANTSSDLVERGNEHAENVLGISKG
jgi:hypothetical protein